MAVLDDQLREVVNAYGPVLEAWFQRDIDELTLPDNIPNDATAYKLFLKWLHTKKEEIKKIQNNQDNPRKFGEYE